MSVTFSLPIIHTGRFTIDVWSETASEFVPVSDYPSYEAASEALALLILSGQVNQGDAFITAENAIDGPTINVSNYNAAAVLAYLGIDTAEDGLVGDIDAADLLARLSVARIDDDGIDGLTEGPTEYDGPLAGLGGRVIYAGRDREQIERYIDGLIAVAERALEVGVRVIWG